MRHPLFSRGCAATLLTLAMLSASADSMYLAPEDFIAGAFDGDPPAPELLWLSTAQRNELRNSLGQELRSLRVRYWQQGMRSAWILDEIGKDQPITTGVIVNNDSIEAIQVLIFRESRGWEIKHTFFSDQFIGARATTDNQLDRHIDGITGATLSVQAVQRQARLALFLAEQLPQPTLADQQ
jgi:hypothetical protein